MTTITTHASGSVDYTPFPDPQLQRLLRLALADGGTVYLPVDEFWSQFDKALVDRGEAMGVLRLVTDGGLGNYTGITITHRGQSLLEANFKPSAWARFWAGLFRV